MNRLKDAYIKALQITSFISLSLGGGIFILSPEFTAIFLGEKWMPIIPTVQALCIFGVTRSINSTFGAVFRGIGRPEIITKKAAIQLSIMVTIIYPLTIKWGILGTALAVILPNFYALATYYITLSKILNCRYLELSQPLVLPLVNVTIIALFSILAKVFIFDDQNITVFITLSLICFAPSFFITLILDKVFELKLQQNLKSILKVFSN